MSSQFLILKQLFNEWQDRGGYVYQGDKAQLQLNLEKNYKRARGSYPLVIVNCKEFDLRFYRTCNKHYEIHDYINDHMMQHTWLGSQFFIKY